MPELPEVETIVNDLKNTQPSIIGAVFLNIWSDFKKIVKKPKNFSEFEKNIKGKKILDIKRRGKNIIFQLSNDYYLLVHQKLTGHLLLGKWKYERGKWISEIPGPLEDDPANRFLHLIFWFEDGRQLALSDLRKFAKVELLKKNELEEELKNIGPEPLEEDLNFERFEKLLRKNGKGKIKQVLMDQKVIAGIGNIYSDEILWQAKVHPFKKVEKLTRKELEGIFEAMKKILQKAIELKGESISDFRRPSGERGKFDLLRRVYRRESEKCVRCETKIKKLKLGGRSTYFCPNCQRL